MKPHIHRAADMTSGMARYWNSLAAKRSNLDVIDPWRTPLKELRNYYPAGTKVYRASTGGRWGKSAQIVVL